MRPQQRRPWLPAGSSAGFVLVGAAALAMAVLWWVTGQATSEQVPIQRPATASPMGPPPMSAVPMSASPMSTGLPAAGAPVDRSSAPSASAHADSLTVDVRGRVRSPGVRRLPTGSRVMDAVEAAGGLLPGHHYGSVNLARILVDGEQIRVGSGSGDPPPAPTVERPSSSSPLIDLNTATAVQLEEVDGVGPVLAAAIVQWRTDNGPYQSIDDLLDVSGIGEATLAGMRDQVTVG